MRHNRVNSSSDGGQGVGLAVLRDALVKNKKRVQGSLKKAGNSYHRN